MSNGQELGPLRRSAAALEEEIRQEALERGIDPGAIAAERIRRWQEKNSGWIEAYNRYVEEAGIFGEEFRPW